MRRSLFSGLLLILAVFGPGVGTAQGQPLQDFVTRFYSEVLGRAPEPAGLAGWVGFLRTSCSAQGFATISQGFFDSVEFRTVRPLSLPGLVTVLYRTFLAREPDPAGLGRGGPT